MSMYVSGVNSIEIFEDNDKNEFLGVLSEKYESGLKKLNKEFVDRATGNYYFIGNTVIMYEDDDMIIIKDIEPKAKNHFLCIPKSHFKLLAEMDEKQAEMVKACLKKIPTLEKELGLENGYRLVINQGDDAGQTVFHLHIHILSGQKMGWTPA